MGHINPINKSWCLEQVCEANYQKLLRLIPLLFSIDQDAIGTALHKSSLFLQVLERNRYTLTIELNHRFAGNPTLEFAPALILRVYRDAKCVEVLRDHSRLAVKQVFKDPGQATAIMDYKWRLNYFLTKWLDYCLRANYQFQQPCETDNSFEPYSNNDHAQNS